MTKFAQPPTRCHRRGLVAKALQRVGRSIDTPLCVAEWPRIASGLGLGLRYGIRKGGPPGWLTRESRAVAWMLSLGQGRQAEVR